MQDAEDFRPDNIRLKPIEATEWNGLVFARLVPGPGFAELVEDVEEIAGADALRNLTHRRRIVYNVGSN